MVHERRILTFGKKYNYTETFCSSFPRCWGSLELIKHFDEVELIQIQLQVESSTAGYVVQVSCQPWNLKVNTRLGSQCWGTLCARAVSPNTHWCLCCHPFNSALTLTDFPSKKQTWDQDLDQVWNLPLEYLELVLRARCGPQCANNGLMDPWTNTYACTVHSAHRRYALETDPHKILTWRPCICLNRTQRGQRPPTMTNMSAKQSRQKQMRRKQKKIQI